MNIFGFEFGKEKTPKKRTRKQNVPSEMTDLYKILATANKEELEKAIIHKDRIKGEHIFNLLVEKDIFSFTDIYNCIQVLYENIAENENKIFFISSSSDITHKDDKTFIFINGENEDKIETEVILSFFPTRREIKNSKLPIVIMPKNEYTVALSSKKKDKIILKGNLSFSFHDVVVDAMNKGSSDIHLSYSDEYAYILFRINGDLSPQPQYLLSLEDGMTLMKRTKQECSDFTKGGFSADEHEVPQSARIEYPDLKVDIRVQFTPKGTQKSINAIVARILKHISLSNKDFSFKDMGYDDNFVTLMKNSEHLHSGVVIITGITGSGKSTTLAHYALTIPTNKRIMTMEDPIEYKLEGKHITQHQQKETDNIKTTFMFSQFVKSTKRSDPDVVYIGEIRKTGNDTSLVDSIVEAGKAGQLVMTTLHVASVFDVHKSMNIVFRVEKSTLSDILLLVIGQVLVKKLCPECRIEDTERVNHSNLKKAKESGSVRYAYTKDLDDFLKNPTTTYVRNEEGCSHCDKGTISRVPIYEYLKPDVDFMVWLQENPHNRFSVELESCSKQNPNLAVNKLTTFIRALKTGTVDSREDTMRKVI